MSYETRYTRSWKEVLETRNRQSPKSSMTWTIQKETGAGHRHTDVTGENMSAERLRRNEWNAWDWLPKYRIRNGGMENNKLQKHKIKHEHEYGKKFDRYLTDNIQYNYIMQYKQQFWKWTYFKIYWNGKYKKYMTRLQIYTYIITIFSNNSTCTFIHYIAKKVPSGQILTPTRLSFPNARLGPRH